MLFMGRTEEWFVLAEEAAQEQDPDKLMEIIEALTHALDERQTRSNGNRHKHGAA